MSSSSYGIGKHFSDRMQFGSMPNLRLFGHCQECTQSSICAGENEKLPCLKRSNLSSSSRNSAEENLAMMSDLKAFVRGDSEPTLIEGFTIHSITEEGGPRTSTSVDVCHNFPSTTAAQLSPLDMTSINNICFELTDADSTLLPVSEASNDSKENTINADDNEQLQNFVTAREETGEMWTTTEESAAVAKLSSEIDEILLR